MLIKLIIIVLILILMIFIFSYFAYRKAFFYKSKRSLVDKYIEKYSIYKDKITSLTEKLKIRKYEEVYIKSYDGLLLFGRYYHQNDNAPLAIAFHGYRGVPTRDFCGGSDIVFNLGYNFLLVDQRAHGKSQGKSITFGIKERYDCLSWINYCKKRFGDDKKIILLGISMGASTVVFSSDLVDKKMVSGIFADSPFSSPKDIIKKVIKDMKLPKFAYLFVWLGALIFGRFNVNKIDGSEIVKKAKVPILIIHGSDDTFVPCHMGKRLYEDYAFKKEFLEIKDADHAISYFVDNDSYLKKCYSFMKDII